MPEEAATRYSLPAAMSGGQYDGVGPRSAILGESASIALLRDVIQVVARGDANVLIAGESGTGKELVAREIHACSARRAHRFVAVNCAALPASLMESELFGHVRGAFTDAKQSHEGLFVQAGCGTVFLDEIGEMPLHLQAKLLRVVEDRSVRPIGSEAEVPVRARLLSATNRDLEAEVEAGRFRDDLYYRVNVVNVCVPPLRARGPDVLLLARHFLRRHARAAERFVTDFAPDAIRCLLDHSWPGNVRELDNCVLRAVTLTCGSEIRREDLPPRIQNSCGASEVVDSETPEDLVSLIEIERRYVRRVLLAAGGNKTAAARILGVDRRTLYRLCDRLDVRIRRRSEGTGT